VYATVTITEPSPGGERAALASATDRYVWYGTATPLVPTTEVLRWYFFADGPTHFFQRPAIVWCVD
jgi:hypothetical protein